MGAGLVVALTCVPPAAHAQQRVHDDVLDGPWHLAMAWADSGSPARVAAVIDAQLLLGDVRRADAILQRLGDRLDSVERLAAAARIAAARREWTVAAQ
ncbi:MAG: hypothetical protein VKI81_10200, partial [Synechococcaceae cyanobacterium]|nr:hypothetical protein [Synechococcaceae cyanobacterium]